MTSNKQLASQILKIAETLVIAAKKTKAKPEVVESKDCFITLKVSVKGTGAKARKVLPELKRMVKEMGADNDVELKVVEGVVVCP